MSAITFAELMNGAKKSQRVEANVSRLNALGEILEICSFDQRAALAASHQAIGELGRDDGQCKSAFQFEGRLLDRLVCGPVL